MSSAKRSGRRPSDVDRRLAVDWANRIPAGEWRLYQPILTEILGRGIPFCLGGGFAFSVHARRWRYTKDMDFYILPSDREVMIEILDHAGFADYHDRQPYDRGWIYRAHRQGVIADLIWAMANQRAEVDASWLDRACEIELHGLALPVLAAEELIWTKLYVMQRDRCDWPDLFNVLHMRGPALDWEHMLARLGPDWPLAAGLVKVFSWLSPARARAFPKWLWARLGLSPPPAGRADHRRIALLDGRDWFGQDPKTCRSAP